MYLCNRKQTMSGTGCSSVRLEYASGGRVVAGSNPVIPTKQKTLDLQQFSGNSGVFLCFILAKDVKKLHIFAQKCTYLHKMFVLCLQKIHFILFLLY